MASGAPEARTQVRVTVVGSGNANVATGVSVLDHLLVLLAEYASFDLALEVAPGDADEEVRAAGRAFGAAALRPARPRAGCPRAAGRARPPTGGTEAPPPTGKSGSRGGSPQHGRAPGGGGRPPRECGKDHPSSGAPRHAQGREPALDEA